MFFLLYMDRLHGTDLASALDQNVNTLPQGIFCNNQRRIDFYRASANVNRGEEHYTSLICAFDQFPGAVWIGLCRTGLGELNRTDQAGAIPFSNFTVCRRHDSLATF